MESRHPAVVTPARPGRRVARDRHLRAWEPRLYCEDAAGAFLAFEAMADRDTHRIAPGIEAKLAATARGDTGRHGDHCTPGFYPRTSGIIAGASPSAVAVILIVLPFTPAWTIAAHSPLKALRVVA